MATYNYSYELSPPYVSSHQQAAARSSKQAGATITGFSSSIHLPAKHLNKIDRKLNFARHFFVALLAACVLAGAIGYGVSAYYVTSNLTSTMGDDLCDKEAASPSERSFVIDIRFGGAYSFVSAKLIDLTWDLFVGQGGRFLHGWVLYKYVVADALTWMMEHSAVPYSYYVNLSFSTVSFASLWSLVKLLTRRSKIRTVLSTLWMIFAVSYALVFATYWSAATGYLAPSTRMYSMPDGTLVPIDSQELSTCWAFDGTRLGLDAGYVELGPTLKATSKLTGSQESDEYYGRSILTGMQLEQSPKVKTSATFRDIFAYAKGMRDLQFYLNFTGGRSSYYDVALTLPPSSSTANMRNDRGFSWQSNSDTINEPPASPPVDLPGTVLGWQYTGIGQDRDDIDIELIDDFYDDWKIQAYAADFVLDSDIKPGPGVVPYNSSIWFDNRTVSLDAPFLEVGQGCVGHNNFLTRLGSCVCYRGQPITRDWYTSDNLICVNQRGYTWGFSSILLLVGLILEAVWVIGCWSVWLDANVNSQLVKYRRRAGGTLRNVLDLAESVNRDLGTDTCAYNDGELAKALERCEPVGYSVEERAGSQHIGVMSEGMRQRPRISYGTVYGTAKT